MDLQPNYQSVNLPTYRTKTQSSYESIKILDNEGTNPQIRCRRITLPTYKSSNILIYPRKKLRQYQSLKVETPPPYLPDWKSIDIPAYYLIYKLPTYQSSNLPIYRSLNLSKYQYISLPIKHSTYK